MYLSNKISVCLAIPINIVESCLRLAEEPPLHFPSVATIILIIVLSAVQIACMIWSSLEYYTVLGSALINYSSPCALSQQRSLNYRFKRVKTKGFDLKFEKKKKNHICPIFLSYVCAGCLAVPPRSDL